VPTPPLEKRWLDRLVADELERHDPETARARLPVEVREVGSADDLAPVAHILVTRSLRRRPLGASGAAPTAADDVAGHVRLLLDLALVRGDRFDPRRRRAEIAAFLAAAVGEHDLALAAYEREVELKAVARVLQTRPVERSLRAAETALELQLHPAGDPLDGLPLHAGHVAVQRRRLARIAMGHHREGGLDPAALVRHAEFAEREAALLAEALAGLLAVAAPVTAPALAVRRRQLLRLGLRGPHLEEVRRAVASPRSPEDLARAAPARVRPFLLEQIFLAALRARLAGEGPSRFADAFAAAGGLDAAAVLAARVEAAAQHGDHHVWFEAFREGGGPSWQTFAREWDGAADQLVERVAAAVTGNLDAVVTEIRETGELGALLAKAAAGAKLTAEEKRKVRAQLVDVAKAVPALAIFAAPGGMLLLPLLAKLLPFSLLPSAWEKGPAKGPAPARSPGRAPPAEPARPPAAPAAPAGEQPDRSRKTETG
jgi:hypothetical protein